MTGPLKVSASARTSGTWTTCFVLATRPSLSRAREDHRIALPSSAHASGGLCAVTRRNRSPSHSQRLPNLALQMRTAFCSNASKDGLERRPARALMTPKTSDVAVCCSRDSVSSRVRACTSSNSRVFSMAIMAWSAKVVTKLDLLSVKGLTSVRATENNTNTSAPLEQWYAEHGACLACCCAAEIGKPRIGECIRHVNCLLSNATPTADPSEVDRMRLAPREMLLVSVAVRREMLKSVAIDA